ncbi:MAG TPA: lipopolysaccharide heptosyltransferase II [Vicinamibacterales bacterium]|nr:lipopolysaccharide heptosyltransferase II [Vicinamibacterales bacterium]
MKRIVVRAPNWLGDAVMALPAIAAVRRHFRDVDLVIAAPPSVSPLFLERTSAEPDRVVAVDVTREAPQLGALSADAVLLLPNSFGSAWTARRSRIGERWGYRAGGRRWLLTRSVGRLRGVVHQVAYYLHLVRELGMTDGDEVPRLAPRESTLARADAALVAAGGRDGDRLIGFAPGAAYGHAKRWPPDRVAGVMKAVSDRGAVPVLLGAAADRDTRRAIESSLPPGTRIIDLIGRTDLATFIGVTARCSAFLSNDSGAMHVAAALGVPLTAVFGPTNEKVTAPAGPGPRDLIRRDVFCRPCMLRECPIDHRCMTRIRIDDVLASLDATSSLPRS